MAKAKNLSLSAIITAFILASSPVLAQQSANQIVGVPAPKQNEVKPTQPTTPALVEQIVAAPIVLPPNAVLPPLPAIVKKSAKAISIPQAQVNAPSINMIQTPAAIENSEPDDDAPPAPKTPKLEALEPKAPKYETQPVLASAVRVNSNYGYRYDPFRGTARFHAGVDLKAAWGDPVCASQSGIIKFAGWHSGYGYMVTIDHGGGITTNYAHLSRIALPVGSRVIRGMIIGSAGSTGRSTSPHLHYEVRINDHPVNPLHPLALDENSDYFTQTQNINTQLRPKVLPVKDNQGSSTKMQQQ